MMIPTPNPIKITVLCISDYADMSECSVYDYYTGSFSTSKNFVEVLLYSLWSRGTQLCDHGDTEDMVALAGRAKSHLMCSKFIFIVTLESRLVSPDDVQGMWYTDLVMTITRQVVYEDYVTKIFHLSPVGHKRELSLLATAAGKRCDLKGGLRDNGEIAMFVNKMVVSLWNRGRFADNSIEKFIYICHMSRLRAY